MAAEQERYCKCRCHAHLWAEHRAHIQLDDAGFHVYRAAQEASRDTPWAATDDVTEAALACEKCLNQHCPALCSTKPTPVIRKAIPPLPPPLAAGDATADTGDPDGN